MGRRMRQKLSSLGPIFAFDAPSPTGCQVYENAADREARRAALWLDAEWLVYVAESAKLGALESQENRLMSQVPFFEIKR